VIALVSTGPEFTQWFSGEAERLRAASPCPVEVWGHEPQVELPAGLEPTAEELEDIIQFQDWRLRTNVPFDPDLTREQWIRFAEVNFNYYTSAFRIARDNRGLTHIVLSGSSRAGQRVVSVAARRLRLNVTCLEPAIFPRPEGAALMLTKGRAHYAAPADQFLDWREHTLDDARVREYRAWWLAERRTKHEKFVERVEPALHDGAVIWFQQVPGDAALYRWWVPDGALDRIERDLRAVDGHVKGHPRADDSHLPRFPADRTIDRKANIHDVLPRCHVAAVLSSAVGMEAWMYGLPVAVYGAPFYAQPELVNSSIPDALASPRVDHAERMRFLDYFIHEYTVLVSDAETTVRRILA
jgi:hypothetical protein